MRLRQLTSAIRSKAPAPVQNALRWLALAWGWVTADLRMRPTIVVVGAQRCGTTTLFRMLEAHPALVRPTQNKGTGYFDDSHHLGPRWYRAHFPLRLTGRLVAGGQARTFECSGYYSFHPLAAERLARELPQAQVVIMVRDPIERALSAYRHEFARGFEDLELEQALDAEPERLAGEEERMVAEPGYCSFDHRHHGYVARGEYARHIARFVDAVGADRVHVVDADAFFADPVEEFERLQVGLGLPTYRPEKVERWNARPGGSPLSPERYAALRAHYEESDARLADYLGRPAWWRR